MGHCGLAESVGMMECALWSIILQIITATIYYPYGLGATVDTANPDCQADMYARTCVRQDYHGFMGNDGAGTLAILLRGSIC
jgi:hypothetical protein